MINTNRSLNSLVMGYRPLEIFTFHHTLSELYKHSPSALRCQSLLFPSWWKRKIDVCLYILKKDEKRKKKKKSLLWMDPSKISILHTLNLHWTGREQTANLVLNFLKINVKREESLLWQHIWKLKIHLTTF